MPVEKRPTKKATRALIQILGQRYGFDAKSAIAWIAEKPEWGWVKPATSGSATAKGGYQAEVRQQYPIQTHIQLSQHPRQTIRDHRHVIPTHSITPSSPHPIH